MIKDSVIKARCSNNEKQQIQEYIQAHDIKESAFLLSAVQTTLQCDIPENHDEEIRFFININVIFYSIEYLILSA